MESKGVSQQCLPSHCGPSAMTRAVCKTSGLLWLGAMLFVSIACDRPEPTKTDASRTSAPSPATASQVKTVPAGLPVMSIMQSNTKQLVRDTGWETVAAHCTACHSEELIVQQRADKDTWKQIIRWMQDTQGLWDLEPAIEKTILAYLVRNYSPQRGSRRQPLKPSLLPRNPYGVPSPKHRIR